MVKPLRANKNKVLLKKKLGVHGLKESVGFFVYPDGASLADFRPIVDGAGIFKNNSSTYSFWDERLPGKVLEGLESHQDVEDFEEIIILFEEQTSGEPIQDIQSGIGHKRKASSMTEDEQAPFLDNSVIDLEVGSAGLGDSVSQGEPDESFPVTSTSLPTKKVNFKSRIMCSEAKQLWQTEVDRLHIWMAAHGYEDHQWSLETKDDEGRICVEFRCLECRCPLGNNVRPEEKQSIIGVFNNYRNNHLGTSKHRRYWATRRGFSIADVKSVQKISKPAFDPRVAVDEALKIVDEKNLIVPEQKDPFKVLGDTSINPPPHYSYQVQCEFCKSKFDLVPAKGNLNHNLTQHLASQKHVDFVHAKRDSALRSGAKGRPSKVDARDLTQKSITNWLKGSTSDFQAGEGLGVDWKLSLLCWGYWKDSITVRTVQGITKEVLIKRFLDDQIMGKEWYSEPHVKAKVLNPETGMIVHIDGLFRHVNCPKISDRGGGFRDLSCDECFNLMARHDDFKMRIRREESAHIKRGDRDTGKGRRLDYLTNKELATYSKQVARSRREDKRRLWFIEMRVAALRTRKPKLAEVLGELHDRKDLLAFLKSIISAYRCGAFGGKEALWHFLVDIGRNVLRESAGMRYSKKTKAIGQALLQFGGRQVVQCFALNLNGPSWRTLRRERSKLVPFRAGLRADIFKEISSILVKAKLNAGITGFVPVILAEDETRVQSKIRWEAKWDILVGFCGPTTDHACSFGYEIDVGNGTDGYDRIVDSFQNCKQGMYARVIICNPLHDKLPKLAICATCTCNKFDANWVREQWNALKEFWDIHCGAVGPIIGHASDGDSRRRKLMLEDYLRNNSNQNRFGIVWDGWSLAACILENGTVYGMGDQDPAHCGKKLINPLDRCTEPLALGAYHACLEHLKRVYDMYPFDDHHLTVDDINRRDRQNWASCQRICSRRVQRCLATIQAKNEERVLGTLLYLETCVDYIDVFFSQKLSLVKRIEACGKVSFTLRLWRLWLKLGSHDVAGNTISYTEKNMISLQAFHDIQMSVHYVVLLMKLFRDHYSYIPVPLHLCGSDCCEIFFSKVGGMSGHERNYDFSTLLDTTAGLNRLATLEFGEEGLKLGRSHTKQEHVWHKYHPLEDGEVTANLGDYSCIQTDDIIVGALKRGFKKAQDVLTRLEMKPSSPQKWWKEPWSIEKKLYPTDARLLDSLVDPDNIEDHTDDDDMEDCTGTKDVMLGTSVDDIADSAEFADGFDDQTIASNEVQHILGDYSSGENTQVQKKKVDHTILCGQNLIYKSTLVSQLNGNPTLSKDRLTRVKQSAYFNPIELRHFNQGGAEGSDAIPTTYLDIGADCAVVFDVEPLQSSITRSSSSRRGKKKATPVTFVSNHQFVKMAWLGRVQKIRRRNGTRWGVSRSPIDLLDKPVPNNPRDKSLVQVLFNWFQPIGTSKTRFQYCNNDLQWIDVESVICLVNLKVNKEGIKTIWTLENHDRLVIDEFLQSNS